MGLLVVNGPVFVLLFVPAFVFADLVEKHVISRDYNWVFFVVFLVGFVLAWTWWSLSVPKWRLWAYQRVVDIPRLKSLAVAVGLTWSDNHVFARTEIKSRAHAKRVRELDPTPDESELNQQLDADDLDDHPNDNSDDEKRPR